VIVEVDAALHKGIPAVSKQPPHITVDMMRYRHNTGCLPHTPGIDMMRYRHNTGCLPHTPGIDMMRYRHNTGCLPHTPDIEMVRYRHNTGCLPHAPDITPLLREGGWGPACSLTAGTGGTGGRVFTAVLQQICRHQAHHSTHHITKRISAEWSIDQHRYSMWHESDGLMQWMHDDACCTEDDVR